MFDTWCRWMFNLFLHEIVFDRHFFIFSIWLPKWPPKSRDYSIIIGLNKNFIYKQHSVIVSHQYVEWFWRYSVLDPYTLNIQESLKHA